MNYLVFAALAATLGTWFLTALGSATVLFFKTPDKRVMNVLLGFAAGVMIAASFWSLLEPAVRRAGASRGTPAYLTVTAGFIVGAVFIWATDKAVSRARDASERLKSRDRRSPDRVFMLVLSITLHNIPEGLAVGVAFGALAGRDITPDSLLGAVTVAVGIGLQNFPEGAAVSVPLRREGYSRVKSFLIGQASGLVEPVAGVAGALLVTQTEAILPFVLSFAAGAMVLVAVHELIPECQKNQSKNPYLATMGIVAGFALMMLLDVMLG